MAGADAEISQAMHQFLGIKRVGRSSDPKKRKHRRICESDLVDIRDNSYATYQSKQRRRNRHIRDTEICSHFAEGCAISTTI